MILRSILAISFIFLYAPAFGMTFADAVEVCKGFYSKVENPQDDLTATFKAEGRINVSFIYANNNVVCSVGIGEKEILEATFGSRVLSRSDIEKAKLTSAALKKEKETIVNGDHAEFVNSAKKIISNKFKDPDSVLFRNLFLSNKAVPTLCGELNAKNSYGGYVGYKGFFHNSISTIVDDGNSKGGGFLYLQLYNDRCGEKFADIN